MEREQIILDMDLQMEVWKKKGDPRLFFLSCYRLMTANMLQAVRDREFHDPEWVYQLLHRFAEYYFDALSRYERKEEGVPPRVWNSAHQQTCSGQLHTLQCLLLGINAHINYDLVLTLYDLLEPEWQVLTDEQKKLRFEDHEKVNDVIYRSIDQVQDEIIEPGDKFMAIIDTLFGRLDEYLLSKLIRGWRTEVWERTVLMLELSDKQECPVLIQQLENDVESRSRQFLFKFR